MALLPYALVTLDEAKAALGISDSSQDAEIEALVNAATRVIEGFTQRAFVQRAFDEYYPGGVNGRRGGSRRIFLQHYPIVSVASITDDAGEEVESDEFTIWPEQGFLEHIWCWPVPLAERGGTGRWRIQYTAGLFATTAAVGADLKDAAYRLMRYWRARKVPGVDSKKVGDFTISFGGGSGGAGGGAADPSLPDDVLVILQPYISRTGG